MDDCIRAARRLAGGMFAVMLVATTGCFAAQGSQGSTLDQVMKLLAQRQQGQVSYTEEDYLALLDRPVKSSGVLVYRAPDHLEKRTLQPEKESLVLEGDELTVQRGHRTYRMQVSAYPQVAPFVDAVRDTLAGNEGGLQKVFNVGFTGTVEQWKLRLVPLDKDVARKVSRVEITGGRDAIHSVEILQADGDRSVMTLGAPLAMQPGAQPGAP